MKSIILYPLFILLVSLVSSGRCADEQPYYPAAKQPPLSRAGLGALEHACKLVAAINALDWKTVEAALPPERNWLFRIKDDAAKKEWAGVGAYRSSDYFQEERILRHRFVYGPGRNHPHEMWFLYTWDGDNFTFKELQILGW